MRMGPCHAAKVGSVDLTPVVTVAGWVIGPIAGAFAGVLFERWRVRLSDQATSRRNAVRQALSVIEEVDGLLEAIEAGYATPPREDAGLIVDEQGRVSGWTELPGLGNYSTEAGLARAVNAAAPHRSRLTRWLVRRRLVELCGQVSYDLRLAPESGWLAVTAMSASWSGRREPYRPEDAVGLLSLALTRGSPPASTRDARRALARLRRQIDR